MATVLLSVGILGAAVALLALRILVIRGGEFRGACASNNPYLTKELGECQACVRKDTEECEYRNAEPDGSKDQEGRLA